MQSNARIIALIASTLIAGCSASNESQVRPGEQELLSWSDFQRLTLRTELGYPLLQGEIVLANDALLRREYDRYVAAVARPRAGADGVGAARSALKVDLTTGSSDDIWAFPKRLNLTYCVAQFSDSTKTQQVINAVEAAAASWSARVAVRMTRVDVPICDALNASWLDFDVVPWVAGLPPLRPAWASSFFPEDVTDRAAMQLQLSYDYWDPNYASSRDSLGLDLEGIFRHELGHAIGLRHEQAGVTWPGYTCGGSQTELDYPFRIVAEALDAPLDSSGVPYDPNSVMFYPQCRNPVGGGYRQTITDYYGTMLLYGVSPALSVAIRG